MTPSPQPRMLTQDELVDLRRDMAASSAWMKSELARRRIDSSMLSLPDRYEEEPNLCVPPDKADE